MMEHTSFLVTDITSRQNFSKNIEDLNSVIKEFDPVTYRRLHLATTSVPSCQIPMKCFKIVLTISHIANEQMSDD